MRELNSNPHHAPTDPDIDATIDLVDASAAVSATDLGSNVPHRLTRKIADGGTRHVSLAEHCSPVKRRVAVKTIKAGQYDSSAVKRLDVERQTSAIVDHPDVAKVFDARPVPQVRPYFVMESVPGLRITSSEIPVKKQTSANCVRLVGGFRAR